MSQFVTASLQGSDVSCSSKVQQELTDAEAKGILPTFFVTHFRIVNSNRGIVFLKNKMLRHCFT